MAGFVYDQAMGDIATGTINLSSDTLKLMLVTTAYTAAKSDTVVGSAAGTPHAAEISATNYTSGYGGAGRKSMARSISVDSSANVVRVIFSGNAVWTALGGASNATIHAAVLIKEITDDGASRLIAYFPLASDLTTNGSDVTLTVDGTNGNITFTL